MRTLTNEKVLSVGPLTNKVGKNGTYTYCKFSILFGTRNGYDTNTGQPRVYEIPFTLEAFHECATAAAALKAGDVVNIEWEPVTYGDHPGQIRIKSIQVVQSAAPAGPADPFAYQQQQAAQTPYAQGFQQGGQQQYPGMFGGQQQSGQAF